MRSIPIRFEITEQHLKLLDNVYISWDDCEYGAPAINCKRPYGNSYVTGDIHEILTGETDVDEDVLEEKESEYYELHRELETVLQIIFNTRSIAVGKYVRDSPYGGKWRLDK